MSQSVIVGLLGATIQESMAPALHEAEGAAQGIPVAYRLVDSDLLGYGEDDLGEALRWAVRFGLTGLNVTHPFKRAVIEHLDELTDEARLLGAVNTVSIRDGRTLGHNTDWVGFGDNFRATLPEAVGDHAVLLGAGGAGVAVGYAAVRGGARRLTVVDVDPGRAEAVATLLAGEFGADRVATAESVESVLPGADGLIQATPIGMTGHEGLPVDPDLLAPHHWVAEIIYFPVETELLRVARAKGCRVVTGYGMTAYQHAAAFEAITGRPASAERLVAHVERLVADKG
ncbi:shikimate dehydrogenase [Actinomycetota bacterium]